MEKFMDIHDNSCSKPSAKRYNFIFMFIPVLFDKLQFIKQFVIQVRMVAPRYLNTSFITPSELSSGKLGT